MEILHLKHWEVRKTLPIFEGQLLVVRICYEIGLYFVPVARENTLGAQGQRLICFVYINFLA